MSIELYFFIVSALNFYTLYFFMGFKNRSFSFLEIIFFSFQSFWFQYQISIMIILSQICEKLKNFNAHLLKVIGSVNEDISKLKELLKDTSKFIIFVSDICDDFSIWNTFVNFVVGFVQSNVEISFSYGIYVSIKNPNYENFAFALFMLNCLLLNWIYSFTYVYYSSTIQRDSNSTLDIIQQGLKFKVLTKENSKFSQILIQQLSHRTPVLTFGPRKLDMFFTFTYICDILSLVIVFVQFYDIK